MCRPSNGPKIGWIFHRQVYQFRTLNDKTDKTDQTVPFAIFMCKIWHFKCKIVYYNKKNFRANEWFGIAFGIIKCFQIWDKGIGHEKYTHPLSARKREPRIEFKSRSITNTKSHSNSYITTTIAITTHVARTSSNNEVPTKKIFFSGENREFPWNNVLGFFFENTVQKISNSAVLR